jgi:RimJ/RimL family protein N-acetyltransferase
MEAARAHRPELPIVAYLLEHNTASARVAEKVGLRLVHRGPDAGNPDADAIRLIYADRALDKAALAATLK